MLPFTCSQMEKMIQIQLLKWMIEENSRSSIPTPLKKRNLTFDPEVKRSLTFERFPPLKRLLTFDPGFV